MSQTDPDPSLKLPEGLLKNPPPLFETPPLRTLLLIMKVHL